MAETPNLALDLIEAAQTQKHVPVNEALSKLDALTHLSVLSRALPAPPASPAEGAAWIVAAGASGAWAGQEAKIAVFLNGGWWFAAAREGMRAWIADESALLVHDGAGWRATTAPPQTLAQLGINTAPDATNRFAVKTDAALFSHDDVTPGSGDLRLTLNKAGSADSVSILFQSAFSGRAEIALSGDEDLSVKVSSDGATFTEALRIDRATAVPHFPLGASGLAAPAFGNALITTAYAAARGVDLIANGTGALGTNYNFPAFAFDPVITPGLPGSFRHAGYHAGPAICTEAIAVDPSRVYRLSAMVHQEDVPGDWSAAPNGPRQQQYAGLYEYDVDGHVITAQHHMRHRHGGTDSMTTLTEPLGPGDTLTKVANAGGWNETSSTAAFLGLSIFEWRNSQGYRYSFYTRYTQPGLFALGGVDKATGTITLSTPFPAALANPDDPSGVWPVGTRIANSSNGLTYKYSLLYGQVVPAVDTWYRRDMRMGGIDQSGYNRQASFSPGTVTARLFLQANYTNRPGGLSTWPDTGSGHHVRFAGLSVTPDPLATAIANADGSRTVHAVSLDVGAGAAVVRSATAATDSGWIAV